MGDLAPFDKVGAGAPMPQQARADEADDQDDRGADKRRNRMIEIKTIHLAFFSCEISRKAALNEPATHRPMVDDKKPMKRRDLYL